MGRLPHGRYVRQPGGRWVAERQARDGLRHLEDVGACVLILVFIFLALEAF